MLETGNPPRRGGTEHRGASAKNNGMMGYEEMVKWGIGKIHIDKEVQDIYK